MTGKRRPIALVLLALAAAGSCGRNPKETRMRPEPDARDATVSPFAPPSAEDLPDGALARLGTTRLRQDNPYSVAWSADGRSLVVGGMTGIHRWDAATGRELMGSSQAGPVRALALSADGRRLAVVPVEVVPDGEAPRPPVIQLWDLESGRRDALVGHRYEIQGLAFAPDGSTLASVGGDPAAFLWDVATKRHRAALTWYVAGPDPGLELIPGWPATPAGCERAIGLGILAFSPDGRTLATEGHDPAPRPGRPFDDAFSIKLWDVASGRLLRVIGSLGPPGSFAFSPDGSRLFASDGTLHAWRVDTGERLWGPVPKQRAGGQGTVEPTPALAVSPDGRIVATGDVSGKIGFFDAADGRLIRSIAAHPFSTISKLAFSPDGARLASGNTGGSIKLWDVATGGEVLAVPDVPTEAVRALAVSPDGRTVATAGPDAIIRVWDLATGRHVRALVGSSLPVETLAFAPDGRSLASGDLAGTLRIWDVATGGELHVFPGQHEQIQSLMFSPDGLTLVAGVQPQGVLGRTARAWATGSGDLLRESSGQGVPLGFTADGRGVVLCNRRGLVGVLDLATGEERPGPIPGPIVFAPGRATPDGSLLSVGFAHDQPEIIDPSGGDRTGPLVASPATSRASAFSPDGRLLAVADGSAIRIVDRASARVVHVFQGHRAAVETLAFAPDGLTLISGSRDTTALIWKLPPAAGPLSP